MLISLLNIIVRQGDHKLKLPTLKEYADNIGWQQAVATLGKPEQTLRSRIKSGKKWLVIDIGKKKRCAMVDE